MKKHNGKLLKKFTGLAFCGVSTYIFIILMLQSVHAEWVHGILGAFMAMMCVLYFISLVKPEWLDD